MTRYNLNDLLSADPKVKYACAKNVLALAGENPAKLYGELDFFVKFLDGENKIIKWTALDVIGALAKIDRAGAIDKQLGKILAFLNGGNMITANHAVAALADIALAKPEYQAAITDSLLKTESYDYATEECRNIVIGKAILAIDRYFAGLEDKEATLEFVERQTRNTRPATRKKAEQFLKKHHRQN